MNKIYNVHADLTPTTVWVKEEIFYNFEIASFKWIKCKLFGITCLTGTVPSFEVITNDGYVFSNIPPHMIRWSENENGQQYDLKNLVYNNCLSEEFVISEFPELTSRKAFVFIKNKQEYVTGQYWFSLDFYKNNNWYHCIKLSNGQFAFIPSHKIMFSTYSKIDANHVFPDYKKLRYEFKV